MQYELLAEYIAFVIISIAIWSFIWDDELETTRYRLFRLLFLGTLFSVIITIATTLTTEYVEFFPLWFVVGLKVVYFIVTPIAPILTFFYAVSLSKWKNSSLSLDTKWLFALLPYGIYILIILLNYQFQNVFTITVEQGYMPGAMNRSTYVVVIIYMIGVIAVSLNNYSRTKQGINLILCINILFASGFSFLQLLFSHIILSGIASATGILLIYLYVQNSMKSIDPLTDVSNRRALMHRINRLSKNKSEFVLYLCSIRNFKSINECFNLETGDSVLENVARRLATIVPKKNIFRYSGDEFVILSHNLSQDDKIFVQAIKKQFERPFTIDNYEVRAEAIYTRVDYPSFSENIKTLLTTADYSIASIKSGAVDVDYLYDICVRDEMVRHNFILEYLKQAVLEESFQVVYQPVYSITEKRFTQAEALVRLRDGQEFSLFPSEFIPIAEKTGLIVEITYIVFEIICKDMSRLSNAVSINFPYVMLLQANLLDNLLKIMKKYDVQANQIKIEITERTLVSDVKIIKNVISDMQDLGFEFELDDFGIEYSNMSVFLSLPIDIIKIDRSLVLAVSESKKSAAFIQSLIKAIIATGRKVIVEGVEDEALLNYFVACGCEYIQGYVFSKPLDLDTFEKFIEEDSSSEKNV